MTEFCLDSEMMARAACAAAARTSPVIIMPDGTEIPLVLYAMRQLVKDEIHKRYLLQAEAEGVRNRFCETLKLDPKNHLYTWETDQPVTQ